MKKWKIALLVVVVLVVAVASYLLYIFKFKEYDVADDEVSQIVEDPYEVELPDGSKLIIGEDGSVTTVGGGESDNTPTETENPDTEEGSEDSGTTGNSTAGVTPPSNNSSKPSTSNKEDSSTEENSSEGNNESSNTTKKPTVATIKAKYEPVFAKLEGQADQKINALIGRAKKEYSDKKANGEKISYGYFYNKYMGAATSLEASTDSVFHGVVKAVEAELEANGYSKSYAQTFVDQYEATKKARRDSIISKATGN
ncbi:hypothetical protein [Sporosarcina sp. SAFN-015]|uniref:hypothetical protein n=1 Tax=Sporosarcina sp. SAFN-015 TaxID=3387274 RepID=UPI003F808421